MKGRGYRKSTLDFVLLPASVYPMGYRAVRCFSGVYEKLLLMHLCKVACVLAGLASDTLASLILSPG